MKIKTYRFIKIFLFSVICLYPKNSFGKFKEKKTKNVGNLVERIAKEIGDDELILKAIKLQNAQNLSLADIKTIDRRWMAAKDEDEVISKLLNKPCSLKLKRFKNTSFCFASEIFVMDYNGALVCSSNRTSDFWQGDEEKWSIPTNTKKEFIAESKFDESTQSYLIQVSVPVQSKSRVIGVVMVGVDLGKVGSTCK